jgi:hypothetical protein
MDNKKHVEIKDIFNNINIINQDILNLKKEINKKQSKKFREKTKSINFLKNFMIKINDKTNDTLIISNKELYYVDDDNKLIIENNSDKIINLFNSNIFNEKYLFINKNQIYIISFEKINILLKKGLEKYPQYVISIKHKCVKKSIEYRRNLASIYKSILEDRVTFQKINPDSYNFSYFPIIFKDEETCVKVFNALEKKGILTRRYFYPSLNLLDFFECKNECPISEDISTRILCLPCHDSVNFENIREITDTILSLTNI